MVVSPVTAYENPNYDDDIDQDDVMPKENINDDKRKSKRSTSSKGVLEITPDPETV